MTVKKPNTSVPAKNTGGAMKRAQAKAAATPQKKTSYDRLVAKANKTSAAALKKTAAKPAKKAAPRTFYQNQSESYSQERIARAGSAVPNQTDRGVKSWSSDYANWNGSGRHGRQPLPGDKKYNF
jgi:hypothetical protein